MKRARYTVTFNVGDDHSIEPPSPSVIQTLLSDAITADFLEIHVSAVTPAWVHKPAGRPVEEQRCHAIFEGKRCGLRRGHPWRHTYFYDGGGETSWANLGDIQQAPAEDEPAEDSRVEEVDGR